jgi:hypothetical protein
MITSIIGVLAQLLPDQLVQPGHPGYPSGSRLAPGPAVISHVMVLSPVIATNKRINSPA